MNKQKMVIIGATGSAYKRTIPALKNSKVCKVIAIQGRDINKLLKISNEYIIPKYYLNAEEMLEKEDYDLVYIATPPFMHLDNISLASKYHKPIISEKPLATSFTEAQKIAKILSPLNTPFMLAHHLRHQKSVEDIKKAIDEKAIGNVLSVWCQWGFSLNKSASSAGWKLDPKLGGYGPFSDAGIHAIDLMLYFFGYPQYVVSHGFQFDFPNGKENMTAIFGYKSKSITLNASQTMVKAGNHLLIYGSKGSIEAYGLFGEKSIRQVKYKTNDNENIKEYPEVNLYGAEVEEFIQSINLGKKGIGTSLEESLLGNSLIDSINYSCDHFNYMCLDD